jgi:hypothetical protein
MIGEDAIACSAAMERRLGAKPRLRDDTRVPAAHVFPYAARADAGAGPAPNPLDALCSHEFPLEQTELAVRRLHCEGDPGKRSCT